MKEVPIWEKSNLSLEEAADIKVSDAQKWIMKLHDEGKGYSTSGQEGGGNP